MKLRRRWSPCTAPFGTACLVALLAGCTPSASPPATKPDWLVIPAANHDRPASTPAVQRSAQRPQSLPARSGPASAEPSGVGFTLPSSNEVAEIRDVRPISTEVTPAEPISEPVVHRAPPSVSPRESFPSREALPMPRVQATAEASQAYQAASAQAARGALFSARSRLVEALRLASEGLDALTGGDDHRRALHDAFDTLDEADKLRAAALVGHAHVGTTTVTPGSSVSWEQCQARALEQLHRALAGSPVAAPTLHALGKLYAHWADAGSTAFADAPGRARVMFRAACGIDPSHVAAANDLGVLEARQGNLPAAQMWLSQSLALAPHPATWQNWTVVQQQAQQGGVVSPTLATASAPAPWQGVQWVGPQAFAGTTQPWAEAVPRANRSPAPSAATAQERPTTASRAAATRGTWWH